MKANTAVQETRRDKAAPVSSTLALTVFMEFLAFHFGFLNRHQAVMPVLIGSPPASSVNRLFMRLADLLLSVASLDGSTVLSRGDAGSTSLFATFGASSLGRVTRFAFGILSRFTVGGYHSHRENSDPV